jgi:acetyl esterase/lipase
MKVTQADHPEVFEQASPDRRITAAAPPMMVFQGVNDTLVPVGVARTFVDRLRATSTSPVVYVELPRTQHAFDVLASVRCRHTSIGAARFLECLRARGLAEAAAGPDRLPIAE